MPRVILMGRKPGAAAALAFLLERGWDVSCVVCPISGEKVWWSPTLAKAARRRNLRTVEQYDLLKALAYPGQDPELDECLSGVDVVVSYLYWKRVHTNLLVLPRLGAINFHPAPLPRYRGLGGYNFAILEGDPSYGVSAHYMSPSIDHGELIRVEEFAIDQQRETALSLYRKTEPRLLELFRSVILLFEQGRPPGHPQPPGRYINRTEFEAAKLIPADAFPAEVERRARAFWFPPYPGARFASDPQSPTLVPAVALDELGRLIHSRGTCGSQPIPAS